MPYQPQPSADRPNIMIVMVRPDMRDLPQCPLPDGFSFRMYQPGDEQHWVRIHELADWLGVRTEQTFFEQFGSDQPGMADRCFFIIAPDGRVVGTSTAWYENDFYGRPWGRVHWVAIVPEFQGRGLARPLLSATMNRLAQSHDCAYLFTHTLRVPAVKLYLNYGFRPLVRSPEEQAGWIKLREYISHPLLDGELWTPQRLEG